MGGIGELEGLLSFHLCKNWEGKGRALARVLSPPSSNVHRIKVDERAGICITTHTSSGISVIHLFSSIVLWCLPRLVFDRMSEEKEVWRLASGKDEVSTHSPPDVEQMDASACAATEYHQYAPRGQFRPWAVLALPSFATMYRLAYPTPIYTNSRHAFLYDVRTGSLVQTIDIHLQICYVDVNERYLLVHGPTSDKFIKPLSVSSKGDQFRARFAAAHVSRDGRDLVVLSHKRRVVFIRDFERICRGETSLEQGGLSLNIRSKDMRGLYIFTFGPDLSAKAVFVLPSKNVSAGSHAISCMQLTDRHIFYMGRCKASAGHTTIRRHGKRAGTATAKSTNFGSRIPSAAAWASRGRFEKGVYPGQAKIEQKTRCMNCHWHVRSRYHTALSGIRSLLSPGPSYKNSRGSLALENIETPQRLKTQTYPSRTNGKRGPKWYRRPSLSIQLNDEHPGIIRI
ncbi:hypothetical protein EDB83DRAFT_2547113 [Lactarius deliciosus]|nr:hypothetical protein EDB83DRAFT_2547113 [Lactarius deliciosus]